MKQDFSVRKSMGFDVLLRKSYRKVEQIWRFLQKCRKSYEAYK